MWCDDSGLNLTQQMLALESMVMAAALGRLVDHIFTGAGVGRLEVGTSQCTTQRTFGVVGPGC
jgi:hypothetical protein